MLGGARAADDCTEELVMQHGAQREQTIPMNQQLMHARTHTLACAPWPLRRITQAHTHRAHVRTQPSTRATLCLRQP
ncbi:hypothetical protein EON67_05315 [archaeon]|nr:MAG: hypothetical protein EON67_05315 [archaeon]